MIDAQKSRGIAIARALLEEAGSQLKLAKLCDVSQPSVCAWGKNGISPVRENDLRFRLPQLKTWVMFPPVSNKTEAS